MHYCKKRHKIIDIVRLNKHIFSNEKKFIKMLKCFFLDDESITDSQPVFYFKSIFPRNLLKTLTTFNEHTLGA